MAIMAIVNILYIHFSSIHENPVKVTHYEEPPETMKKKLGALYSFQRCLISSHTRAGRNLCII